MRARSTPESPPGICCAWGRSSTSAATTAPGAASGRPPSSPRPTTWSFCCATARGRGGAPACGWRSAPWRPCPGAGSSTTWGAASPATPPTGHGWPPTLKRCSTTTPCCSGPIRRGTGGWAAPASPARPGRRRTTCCGSSPPPRAASAAGRTRTAAAWRGNTTSSRPRSWRRCWAGRTRGGSAAGTASPPGATSRAGASPTASAAGAARQRGWTGCAAACTATGAPATPSTGTTRCSPPGTA